MLAAEQDKSLHGEAANAWSAGRPPRVFDRTSTRVRGAAQDRDTAITLR
jgi:hypothetical protein